MCTIEYYTFVRLLIDLMANAAGGKNEFVSLFLQSLHVYGV